MQDHYEPVVHDATLGNLRRSGIGSVGVYEAERQFSEGTMRISLVMNAPEEFDAVAEEARGLVHELPALVEKCRRFSVEGLGQALAALLGREADAMDDAAKAALFRPRALVVRPDRAQLVLASGADGAPPGVMVRVAVEKGEPVGLDVEG